MASLSILELDAPPPIRVLLAGLPGVLAALVRNLVQQQADMELVGQVADRLDLLLAAGAGVDVLVLGAPKVYPAPGICSHLLSAFPDLRILVVTPNGEAAMLYWRGLRRHRLAPVSAPTLVQGIRQLYALNPAR